MYSMNMSHLVGMTIQSSLQYKEGPINPSHTEVVFSSVELRTEDRTPNHGSVGCF